MAIIACPIEDPIYIWETKTHRSRTYKGIGYFTLGLLGGKGFVGKTLCCWLDWSRAWQDKCFFLHLALMMRLETLEDRKSAHG